MEVTRGARVRARRDYKPRFVSGSARNYCNNKDTNYLMFFSHRMSSLKAIFLSVLVLFLSTSCALQLEAKNDEKTGGLSYNAQEKRDDETKTDSSNNLQRDSASGINRGEDMVTSADLAEIKQRSFMGRKAQPPGLWGRSLRNQPPGLWGRQATVEEEEEDSDDERKINNRIPGLWGRGLKNRTPRLWERSGEDEKNLREEHENDIFLPQNKPPGLWGRGINDHEDFEDKSMRALTGPWERGLRNNRPGLWGRGIEGSHPGLWGRNTRDDPSENWSRQLRPGLWGRALRNSPKELWRRNFLPSETDEDKDIDFNNK